MKKQIFANRFKITGSTSLLLLVAYILLFVPPTNIFIILGFTICLSLATLYLVSFFTWDRRNPILAALFVGILLLLNVFIGFNIVNTLLLASFIIGLRILLK